MEIKGLKSLLVALLMSLAAGTMLSGCGGGGGGGGASLSGTAATGAAVDGFVYVTDSNGVEVNAPIEADGYFSISVDGMTPPYLLRVVPNGGGDILYSFASADGITVNITPLTTLALYLSFEGNLDELYAAWSASLEALDDASIEDKQVLINANLQALFESFGIEATFYDFMHVEFDTDGTGIDGVLDALDIQIDWIGDSFTVLVDGEEHVWNPEIDTSAFNIGDFGIAEGSLWQLTVTDSINDIEHSEIVEWPGVPNDLSQFEGISLDGVMEEFQFEGLTIEMDIDIVNWSVTGNGEIGTVISGRIKGTVHISGEFEGQPVNETVNLDTTFTWERIAEAIF